MKLKYIPFSFDVVHSVLSASGFYYFNVDGVCFLKKTETYSE